MDYVLLYLYLSAAGLSWDGMLKMTKNFENILKTWNFT